MTPEEFYWKNKLSNDEYMKEIRIRSLSWVLDCYERGTIRRRTIKGLISEESLLLLLKEMEEVERYEECIIIKEIIDRIYHPLEFNINEPMSKKRQKEIIELLENTLIEESKKPMGGNSELVEALTKKLEKVKNWQKKENEK
jgi:hypothetical protein